MKIRSFLFNEAGGAGDAGGGGAGAGGQGAAGGGQTIFGGGGAGGSSAGSSQHAGAAGGGQGGGDAGAGAAAAGGQGWNWTKEDGTFSEGWFDKLPDGLKGNASLKTIHSLPDLAKAFIETKGLVGKKLEAPGEGATPEQIAAWRKTVGAPEKPEGYRGDAKTLKPEGLPDELWDADAEGKFLDIAHRHHLPPAAVKEILGFYGQSLLDTAKAGEADAAKLVEAETAKLRQSWGADFEANINNAKTLAQLAGLDPLADPMFTSARYVEAFAKLSKLIAGDKLVTGETPSLGATVADRIKDISDPGSQSMIAREYRGEFGAQRQQAAQATYHQLLASQKKN